MKRVLLASNGNLHKSLFGIWLLYQAARHGANELLRAPLHTLCALCYKDYCICFNLRAIVPLQLKQSCFLSLAWGFATFSPLVFLLPAFDALLFAHAYWILTDVTFMLGCFFLPHLPPAAQA